MPRSDKPLVIFYALRSAIQNDLLEISAPCLLIVILHAKQPVKCHYSFFLQVNTCKALSDSKTCLKRPPQNRQNKSLKTNGSLMKVESIAECSLGVLCNTFGLH